ncbi:hypothetical protein [Thioclava electrotropha]|uniref:Uncharacterized protein n=1 Tax=Thioclava electrotropha TaxID=1549850 RepID=A0ABX6YQ91_9RHOB|nr:hypothetical protein [Thioclava electrotropha]QPZ89967.1 hypothetical protein AKL02_003040 [Thioclava electrotropha]
MKPVTIPQERRAEFEKHLARLEWLNGEMDRLASSYKNGDIDAEVWFNQNQPLLHEQWEIIEKIKAFND